MEPSAATAVDSRSCVTWCAWPESSGSQSAVVTAWSASSACCRGRRLGPRVLLAVLEVGGPGRATPTQSSCHTAAFSLLLARQRGSGGLSAVSSQRGHAPHLGDPTFVASPEPNYLPEARLPWWELGLQRMRLGGHRHSLHNVVFVPSCFTRVWVVR